MWNYLEDLVVHKMCFLFYVHTATLLFHCGLVEKPSLVEIPNQVQKPKGSNRIAKGLRIKREASESEVGQKRQRPKERQEADKKAQSELIESDQDLFSKYYYNI